MKASFLREKDLVRSLWFKLSPSVRYKLRRMFFFPLDTWERLSGKNHKYVPPRGAVFTGGSDSAADFIAYGKQQVAILEKYTNLSPSDHVLDIGCGVGRTAIGLTGFLEKKGSYDGFDVVEKGIQWCQKGIGRDFSNFRFKHVSLFNDLYRKSGTDAANFKFPYPDNSFDMLFSIHTYRNQRDPELPS